MTSVGRRTARVQELAKVSDRISFLYVERCVVNRDSNAITSTTVHGTVHIPAAAVACLLLGPGTSVTHQAMVLLADSGTTAVWTGEGAVRYYAHGDSLTRSSRLLERQASAVSNQRTRLAVARAMYERRFPGEDVSGLSMEQLRGREGARVRASYREHSRRTGVPWNSRQFDPENFALGDTVNQALSAANHSLYGLIHAVVVALGCSPSLGFVHTGHQRSFVHDVADLYKAEMTIPLAFDIASELDEAEAAEVGSMTRRRFRDAQYDGKLLGRAAQDIKQLLAPDDPDVEDLLAGDVIMLWDDRVGQVAGGRSYDAEMPW